MRRAGSRLVLEWSDPDKIAVTVAGPGSPTAPAPPHSPPRAGNDAPRTGLLRLAAMRAGAAAFDHAGAGSA